MDFLLSDIHDDLASSVDTLLTKADTPAVARAWAGGDHSPAAGVFRQLADIGVFGLLIDEEHGGAGAGAVEMVVALEQIGRHPLAGPIVESVAVVPILLRSATESDALDAAASGRLSSAAIAPLSPRAADTDAAERVYVVDNDVLSLATVDDTAQSVDPTRTVSTVRPAEVITEGVDGDRAAQFGALATAAQLLGLGSTMLRIASDYALSRRQFGRQIGSFQAVKHHLADVAIALEMARPLVHGAAVGIDGGVPEGVDASRDISAAKVAAADAAYLASRRSLQVLGAIGYTSEHDLSLYLTKTRALVSAWGTPAQHRARILESL